MAPTTINDHTDFPSAATRTLWYEDYSAEVETHTTCSLCDSTFRRELSSIIVRTGSDPSAVLAFASHLCSERAPPFDLRRKISYKPRMEPPHNEGLTPWAPCVLCLMFAV